MSSSRFDNDLHPILRPQRHRGKNFHWMIRDEFESKLFTDRHQHHNHFHHCERCADAGARTGAEREVRVLRKLRFELSRPTFRLELLWLLKEARVAMRRPLKHEYLSSSRHVIAANLAIVYCFAAQTVRR